MSSNYVLLERIELNTTATSVTFANIPQTGYTDLKIVASTRTNYNGAGGGSNLRDNLNYYFNGDSSGTSWTNKQLYAIPTVVNGSGGGSGGSQGAVGYQNGAGNTASTFSIGEIYVPNYNSSSQKSSLGHGASESNDSSIGLALNANLYASTSPVTSVTLVSGNSGVFQQYSSFSLYGIAALATSPTIAPKASGGNIATDGTYWYHSFINSGTFTPSTNITCETLVIAGGGGGGGNSGGGGGAGGFRTATSISLTTTNYAVTVGSGGAGSPSETYSGSSGSDSVFSTITSTGGGFGAGYSTAGGNGGSGGGGNEVPSTAGGSGNTPSTSPSQGNNGAAGSSPSGRGGGGGGAAASGSNKDGGNGSYTLISGGAATGYGVLSSGNYYFAGGAGAGGSGSVGVGGLGGGGTGCAGTGSAQTSGTINTGSGGGGGGNSARYGMSGGSGIVIIRYAI